MAESMTAPGEMKRTLTLTGITVNAMSLIAPGAFLWTTYQIQASQVSGTTSTAAAMWGGLFFALILAMLTAYSYSELARAYPDAGTGSSYYFAEAALLEKEKPEHRKYARFAKLWIGWISHLYYWLYPGIMVAFTGTLFYYIYATVAHHNLTWLPLSGICVVFAFISGYIAFRGISGSTMTAIIINVIQITSLMAVSVIFIAYRIGHHNKVYEISSAVKVIIPSSFIHVLYQGTIAILLLVGFESVTALGAEAIRPEKDIKRGILLSLLIQGGICYLIEYFAANFAAGSGTETYAKAGVDAAPMGTMLKAVGDQMLGSTGTTISLIVAVTVLLALIGTTLACLNTGVRVTYTMAKDKEMPSVLGLLHGRFATPHGGIWVLTGLSALIGIYAVDPYTVHPITQVTLASNTGTFLVYGMTCFIAVIAFSHRHDKNIFRHYVIPILGALMNIAMLLAVVYLAVKSGGQGASDAYKALGTVALWMVLGGIWFVVNPSMRGKKILDPNAPKREQVIPTSV
jgi:amino acid transporter